MDKPYKKLHIGCGPFTPSGWVNLDGSWNAKLAKFKFLRKILGKFRIIPPHLAEISWNLDIVHHDIRKPFPFKNDTFSAIYASHVLENLYLDEAKSLLKECHRILRPGGVLRIMVHDLRKAALNYISGNNLKDSKDQKTKADEFLTTLSIRHEFPKGSIFYKIYTLFNDYHTYKWLYDSESLIFHFKEAGFEKVEQKPVLQSKIEDIKAVEVNIHSRVSCVEGVKLNKLN